MDHPRNMLSTQVAASHYVWNSYNTPARWASYWHQIDEVLHFDPKTCLVIGPGEGTVVDMQRRLGIKVTTSDVAADLHPDVVADVRDLPLGNQSVDVVLCAQVLEHLPFGDVPRALSEIARVTRVGAVVSVPQNGRLLQVSLKLPALPRRQFAWWLPSRHRYTFDGEHYWQLGARGASRRTFRRALEKRFVIEREYLAPANPYHRFFVLVPNPSRGSTPNPHDHS
jgi:SAM-dependent methyltransferase